jgi:hypothetical protein
VGPAGVHGAWQADRPPTGCDHTVVGERIDEHAEPVGRGGFHGWIEEDEEPAVRRCGAGVRGGPKGGPSGRRHDPDRRAAGRRIHDRLVARRGDEDQLTRPVGRAGNCGDELRREAPPTADHADNRDEVARAGSRPGGLGLHPRADRAARSARPPFRTGTACPAPKEAVANDPDPQPDPPPWTGDRVPAAEDGLAKPVLAARARARELVLQHCQLAFQVPGAGLGAAQLAGQLASGPTSVASRSTADVALALGRPARVRLDRPARPRQPVKSRPPVLPRGEPHLARAAACQRQVAGDQPAPRRST